MSNACERQGARKLDEFGVKAGLAVTRRRGLMVGARTFPGNPYDSHMLSARLEQTSILLERPGRIPKQVPVDLHFMMTNSGPLVALPVTGQRIWRGRLDYSKHRATASQFDCSQECYGVNSKRLVVQIIL